MKLGPNAVKYRKMHKIKLKMLNFDRKSFMSKTSCYGLRTTTSGKIKMKQLETVRVFYRRLFKKHGILRFNVFPYASITRKSKHSRMGKGKGKHSFWIFPIKKGRIFLNVLWSETEFGFSVTKSGCKRVGKKLPVAIKFFSNLF